MSVDTTADESIELAADHVQSAVDYLSKVVTTTLMRQKL